MAQQQPRLRQPYAPQAAILGETPSILPDVPVCTILIAVYLTFAVSNLTIFQINRRKHHKFPPTLFLFGFSMARVATLVLRIVWANIQQNVRLSVAANIFAAAGVLVIYVIHVVLAQRILRAENPHLGWNHPTRTIFQVFYAGVGGALIMVITATVLSAYTLNMSTLLATRNVQRAASIYLLIFTTLPTFLLTAAHLKPALDRESFGQGSIQLKKVIILTTTLLAIVNAGYRTGTACMPPRSIDNPSWYQGKPAFYVFNFAIEIIILAILTITRIDQLFFVPDGSKAPGDYTRLSTHDVSDGEKSLGTS